MRVFAVFLLACSGLVAAGSADEKPVLAAVQVLFDGMSRHDASLVRGAFTPDARIVLTRDAKVVLNVSGDEFAQRVGAGTASSLERIWEPKVFIRGSIATVWAEYDYYSGGKFNHCGIDSFLLLKTEAGWKIFSGASTSETQGCTPSPLGPPKN